MFSRQFINLVVKDFRVGGSYWLSRLMPEENICVKANANGDQDSLYAINRAYPSEFEALVHCNPYGLGRRDENKAWHWRKLPLPPYLDHPDCEDRTIQSYTLLEDGKTICFSSVRDKGGFGTYFFDTSNHQWAKAGGWVLPFYGRALQVPELHGLWFGIGDNQHELCAADLSSLDCAPEVLHRWQSSNPPKHWLLIGSSMVYLGANRFCVAKTFGVYSKPQKHDEELAPHTAAILTGVEIVNGEANKGKLRMVEHKSRTYIFERCGIMSVF
ncbi:uncharacterized protein [Triticum aestivum]|uniref:uncharacterized protein n=1 Tax=Triticum aestivum TaxID=4565 RepID=UPI001D00D3B4|nr:uncharacterized protein LOC123186640 [Triticum aestivum]